MLSRTQALIRLAQVFDESGLHSTADIVDGRMWRIALDMSDISPKEDETTEKYRSILNREYRNRFKIKPGDSNFTSYRNEESYWVLPDGSTILLDGIGHGDAIEGIEHKTKSDNGVRLSKDPEYQEFKNRYWDSYHMVSNTLGAIRVYAEMGNRLVVTAYTVPTQQQLNTIDNLKQYWSTNSLNIEQFGHVLGGRQRFTNIPEWEIAVEKYERASKASGGVSPQTSEFKNTINQVDETNQQGDEPYWKSMERRKLEEQYPGEANAPLRKMYERSAGTRTADQLEMDFDEPVDKDSLEQEAKSALISAWTQTYPKKAPEAYVSHTNGDMNNGSQSYWVFPDGSRIELGTTWHGEALSDVLNKHDLKDHPGIKIMKEKHDDNYYQMMADYYGAVRVYVYPRPATVSGSSYTVPTDEQFRTIENIARGLGVNKFEMMQQMPDGSTKYFYSMEDWKDTMVSKRPPKPQRKIDQQILETENSGQDFWRAMEQRNLEERYPGDENARFRRMYMRSAGTRTASRDDYYRQALEEGHKAKFKVLEPEEPVEQFRNMHSFWLYPDGRVMDLGKQWHEDAFNSVMQEAGLDAEEEFGKMYSSKDGPHEIMSDYFGMIRLFIQDKNSMVVTSYRKPTQAQIDQIQNISQQSGRGVIKIEQYGYVNGGRLVTNSMAKWIDELGKYRPDAEGQSSYNTMRNNIDETNDTAKEQPYWKARERQNLETTYPGPENEQLRKMYERSASNGC